MSGTDILNGIFLIFAVLGAIDYICDNRWGLGSQFERGICCSGKLIIAMTGFMTLAPILGAVLSPIVNPVFSLIGADPSALAGILLANDSGGASLAMAMAVDQEAGQFNGYFIASMIGASIMCMIPMTILSTKGKNRKAGIYGLVIGIFTSPFGCAIGGLAAGYRIKMILLNLIPGTIIAFVLFFLLIVIGDRMIGPFQLFGKILIAVSLSGLMLTALKEIMGIEILKNMVPFSEIILVIGNIALVLSGVFPLLHVVSAVFGKAFGYMADKLRISGKDFSGLLMSLVNIFPVFDMYGEMSPKGVMLNAAFMIGANCAFGDHFAFTSQMAPELVIPVMIAKLTSSFMALGIALLLSQRLLKEN